MLSDLDSIPWSSLEHAYGDAGDIPDIIRKLASSDSDEREWAHDMLEMGPFHQGSIYSSTPFVVRILMQLVQEPETLDKPWMLRYVSAGLASVRYILPDPGTPLLGMEPDLDADVMIAAQVVMEVRPYLTTLLWFLDDRDELMRLSVLRLLVLLKSELPHLARNLAMALKTEAQEPTRGALVFCLALLADTNLLASVLETLDDITEPHLVRIAAGFGVIAAEKVDIPDGVVTVICGLISEHYRALDTFEDTYADYLTPLGAPRGKDRLLECLDDSLSGHQRDEVVQALQRIYAQLPMHPSVGVRIGAGYYRETMVRLAFPKGKLPPETTIRDLTDTQRGVLEAFQKYDMPYVNWNVYSSDDYRKVLGLTFRKEADFLDFMAGKRSARETI